MRFVWRLHGTESVLMHGVAAKARSRRFGLACNKIPSRHQAAI
jgi:hypothetical protein